MKNRVIHGDCLKYLPKIKDSSIDLIIIDPPYIVTKEKWDKKDIVTEDLVKQLYRVLKDTGNIYCWCGIGEKSQTMINWFILFNKIFYFKDLITWKKQRGMGMRKGWLYTREEIMWFVKDNKKFTWNKEEQYSKQQRAFIIKKKGGERVSKSPFKRFSNVWEDIMEETLGTSPQKSTEIAKLKTHFTPKPIKAIERIIKLHTNKDDLVLDPMAGSGTTAIACLNTGRNYILIEKELKYYNVIRKRIIENEG